MGQTADLILYPHIKHAITLCLVMDSSLGRNLTLVQQDYPSAVHPHRLPQEVW